DALFDEDAYECSRQALPHGPALQGRVRRDTLAVSLANDPSLPRHHKGGGHPRGGLEGRVHGRPYRGCVELRWQGIRRQQIAHRPGLRRGVREGARDADRLEVERGSAHWKRDAPLVTKKLGRAPHAVGERDVHGLTSTI